MKKKRGEAFEKLDYRSFGKSYYYNSLKKGIVVVVVDSEASDRVYWLRMTEEIVVVVAVAVEDMIVDNKAEIEREGDLVELDIESMGSVSHFEVPIEAFVVVNIVLAAVDLKRIDKIRTEKDKSLVVDYMAYS